MPFGDSTAATRTRLEKAEVRRKLRSGELTLTELLANMPKCVRNTPTMFILDMIPYVGNSTLAQVNYEAAKYGINLALPLGALTERAKTFLRDWDEERRERIRKSREKRNNGTTC